MENHTSLNVIISQSCITAGIQVKRNSGNPTQLKISSRQIIHNTKQAKTLAITNEQIRIMNGKLKSNYLPLVLYCGGVFTKK